ncbi:MAG: 50S ribosomal protein L15 [Oligoflexia bacterium]|nr:50S ribosomal protein L15 [Oligoflexia bacterium]
MRLNNLKGVKGSHRNTKRLGRGPGSGQGAQAGKGHKGHKARAGGGVRLGFEGGNLPMYMRLPKVRNFTNFNFKKVCAIVDLFNIERAFNENEEVTHEALIERNLIKGKKRSLPVKILSRKGSLTKKLKFKGIDSLSENASNVIKSAGGTIEE